MRNIVTGIAAMLLLSSLPTAHATNVIAATATSSAPQAASVTCLLKADCGGAWSPGSADSGANEGLYLQFDAPVDADAVELVTNVKDAAPAFTLSINGAVAAKAPVVKPIAGSAGRYSAHYAAPAGHIKSIFFRLGVRKGGWQKFSVYGIRFYQQGKPVELALPVLASASVTASSVLDPAVAYQPANLFDSRFDSAKRRRNNIAAI